METILVICRNYPAIKRRMNKTYKDYSAYKPTARLTNQTIDIEYEDKVVLRFIFRSLADYPEKIMGLEFNGVFLDEPMDVPAEMSLYLLAHKRQGILRR
jgi:hypothetical protein